MKIADVICTPGVSGFYFDDQKAIKGGLSHDGFFYEGQPVTEGFSRVRTAGQAISVMIMLEDGRYATGDCAAVQYSGTGGRDPLFLAENYRPVIDGRIREALVGRSLKSFRELAGEIDEMQRSDGGRLHTALRYGVSQAILEAVSLSRDELPVETVCREYGLPLINEPIPLFGQSGDDRYLAVDKMLLKGVDVLPHGLINEIETKLGRDGSLLKEYIRWLRSRAESYGDRPVTLHLDVYGTIGMIFDHDPKRITEYIARLQDDAGDLPLYIEGPVDMGERTAQIGMMKRITDSLRAIGSPVRLVADEWCNTYDDIRAFTDERACHMVQIKTPDLGSIHNTIESVLYCKEHGMEAYQGGTCNETDISAKSCVHAALAARPDRLLVKPGMGFDEGYTIVKNEMNRTIAALKHREKRRDVQ